MKKLLIHSNNTSLNTEGLFSYDEQFGFDIDFGKNVDEYIDEKIHGELGKKLSKTDIVFIKIALTKNYLEYLGIRLAYHIRLTESLGEKRYIPIVFIAQESFQFLGLTANNPSLLFTNGIYLIKESLKDLNTSLEQFKEGIIIPLKNYQNFINRIRINPPSNYNSHHSIDNELALLRWSEYLRFNQQTLQVEDNIRTSLFFKYHRLKNPVKPVNAGSRCLISKPGKVILIDDEAGKGWLSFYKYFFEYNLNNKSIELIGIGEDFKSLNKRQIIDNSLKKVRENKPSLVLLDLRLCDSDFRDDVDSKDLTGYEILSEIKNFNKGIQVIITTASNKVWNYEVLLEKGIVGYIIKSGKSDVSKDISNLKNKIELGLRAADCLMGFHEISDKIISNLYTESEWKDEFKVRIKNHLEISFNFLEKSFIDKTFLRYTYLQLFLIIEEFLYQDHIFSIGEMCYVNNNILVAQKTELDSRTYSSVISRDSETGVYSIGNCKYNQYIGVDYKMSAVLIFRYGFDSSDIKDWHALNHKRNSAAHSVAENLTIGNVRDLLEFIEFITDSTRKKIRMVEEGLLKLSDEERLQRLKEKFEGS